jgi:hypothetical protein
LDYVICALLFCSCFLHVVQVLCYLWSTLCILCFVETFFALMFLFYWSTFHFGVFILLKYFLL